MTPETPQNNTDAAELAMFNRLADQWWNPSGEFKTLHEINPLRLQYILDNAGLLTGKKIIDVGCGGGILSESLARNSASVTAIDLAEDGLIAARKHADKEGLIIDYRLISVESLAREQAAQYDIVSCMEMLEHVPDPISIIESCERLCKPGGHVFFSTLNRHPKAFLFGIVGAEYLLRLLPRGTHHYEKFIKPAELANAAQKAGLTVEDICGFRYDPFLGKHALGKDIEINYLMHCTKGFSEHAE